MIDLISVIIPIYNTPKKLLEKCLKSIINQSYNYLEIIIVDDGSNAECVKNYSNILTKEKRAKIITKKNTGVSDSRNVGLKEAKGKYIMFVDSDDYLDLNYIEYLYNSLINNDVNIAISGATIVNENFQKIGKMIYYFKKSKMKINDYIDVVINYPYFTCVKMLFKKNIVKKTFKTDMKYGEDLLFTINLIKDNDIIYVDNCGYYYVQNSSSAIYSFDENRVMKYIDDNKYLFEQIEIFFPEKKDIINNRLVTKLNICLTRFCQNKKVNYKQFHQFLKYCLKKIDVSKLKIKDINYISKIDKLKLKILYKKKYFILYIINKIIYKIKKLVK